ncbi:MAG: alanine racemase [Acidobacteriota bacterium]
MSRAALSPTVLAPADAASAVDVPLHDRIASHGDLAGLATWIELSESALAHNLAFFRGLVGPDVELSSVIKANAYGHGALEMARLVTRHGADSFCVHAVEEATALRRAGYAQDVLILGHVPHARLDEVVGGGFRVVAFNLESVERLAARARALGRPARLHLKIETGTHRQGVEGAALDALVECVAASPWLVLDGVYTHFADIEDTTDPTNARRQLARFRAALERIEAAGLDPGTRHAACSAAALVDGATHFDMLRLGIGQYGFWSSGETLVSHRLHNPQAARGDLRPVATWKTRIGQLKWIDDGAAVGYGGTWRATRQTRLAVLPIGYSDGYDRSLSNAAHVLVRGRRAPVRGRVCMNLLLVDVTDVPEVMLEDEVVLLGRQGASEVTAEELASLAGTIHYEIVARLRAGMPRRIVD